jgi:serine/threonine protein kinase
LSGEHMATDNEPTNKDVSPEHPDLIGKQLGDFKIHKLLGQGGMGEVYLAEQVSLKRRVALKILRRDMLKDEKYLRRFEAEAKAVAPISHPNIVSVIAIGEDQGIHYIALEYVQGMNLRDYVDRKGPLDLPTCKFIIRKVAEALQRAGEEGIVHRDIKPENVLVTRKNEVKVADFGLARQVTGQKVDLTQTGVTMGTPLYMSPEQVEGKALDPRSDIYSFGVMCYYMMTGKPPFRGDGRRHPTRQGNPGAAGPAASGFARGFDCDRREDDGEKPRRTLPDRQGDYPGSRPHAGQEFHADGNRRRHRGR